MNILHMKYAVEVAKAGSLSKASEVLLIAHGDPYVPSLPLSRVMKEELPDNTDRRIYVFERANQLDLLW